MPAYYNPYSASQTVPNNFTMNSMPQTQQTYGGINVVMVSGETGANNYPVAAGNTVLLMDFDSKKFWLKSTDINGFPQPLRSFDFTEQVAQHTDIPKVEYATKKDIDEVKKMIEDLFK